MYWYTKTSILKISYSYHGFYLALKYQVILPFPVCMSKLMSSWRHRPRTCVVTGSNPDNPCYFYHYRSPRISWLSYYLFILVLRTGLLSMEKILAVFKNMLFFVVYSLMWMTPPIPNRRDGSGFIRDPWYEAATWTAHFKTLVLNLVRIQ